MRKNALIPGGMEAQVRRRASGKCELCSTEYDLSVHHVIPRASGGLNHEDNLALLCKRCHDRIEGEKCNTRRDLLRLAEKPAKTTEEVKSRAEKMAATKVENAKEARQEEDEIRAWNKWEYATAQIPYYTAAEAARLPSPLKNWHAWVYGGAPRPGK